MPRLPSWGTAPALAAAGWVTSTVLTPLAAQSKHEKPQPATIGVEDLRSGAKLAGLRWTDEELAQMLPSARRNLASFARLRARSLPNSVPPALRFLPIVARPGHADLAQASDVAPSAAPTSIAGAERPQRLEDLAFEPIATLSTLIRTRKVSCAELTDLFLRRLQQHDESLHCVVHVLADRARARADELDEMLAGGEWLGPLHGIPFGAKDLLSARGAPTTWGAAPFRDQTIDHDAAVVRQLEARGAVLLAKLTLGALAMGDRWFGGMTRNPWNPEQGSSGSSAGSASATAAGLVPFAIGSETLGSIISPSVRCGVTGLRPTFGAVSTEGAMALSWSMDKLGPLCRSAADAELVFDAIRDPVLGAGWFQPRRQNDLRGMTIGYLERETQGRDGQPTAVGKALRILEEMGAETRALELPSYPLRALTIVLTCEAAAAFDEFTRTNRDDELTMQRANSWPNLFRSARSVPAVEYIRAQRLRTQLMRDVERALDGVDVWVHPTHGGPHLTMTNLTGHPTIACPTAARKNRSPGAIAFSGRLWGEAKLLHVARLWQERTKFHQAHPVRYR